MKISKRNILLIIFLIALIIFLIWFWNGMKNYLYSDERRPGRDTVAFWKLENEGFVYEICQSQGDFTFYAMEGVVVQPDTTAFNVNHIHFYANTTDSIFLISTDGLCYQVDKKECSLISSSLFESVPSTEENVCFINLLNPKSASFIKEYNK